MFIEVERGCSLSCVEPGNNVYIVIIDLFRFAHTQLGEQLLRPNRQLQICLDLCGNSLGRWNVTHGTIRGGSPAGSASVRGDIVAVRQMNDRRSLAGNFAEDVDREL